MEYTRFGPEEGSRADRPLGELVRDLATESSNLVRQEIVLARTEMRRNFRDLGGDLARIALGGAIVAVGALALLAGVIVLVGELLGGLYWISAGAVGITLAAIGGIFAYAGASRMRERDLKPEATMASLQTTQRWATREISELRSVLGTPDAGDSPAIHEPTEVRRQALVQRELAASAPPRLPSASGPGIRVEPADPGAPGGREGEGGGRQRSAASADGSKAGLVKRVGSEFMEDDGLGQAAKIAFYLFTSFPPAVLVLFALTGFFGGEDTAAWLTMQLQGALPDAASDLIDEFVNQIVHDTAPGPFSVGLLLALWAASAVFVAVSDSLNLAYDAEESRSFVKRRAISLAVMFLSAVLLLIGAFVLLAGPAVAGAIELGGAADLAWTILQWPLAFFVVACAFWIMYYLLPDRDQSAQKLTLLKGSAIAALLWVVATAGFRLYIANFGNYTETYGLLGGVIVLLLWLYITGIVVVLGGELNSELEQEARAN